jgi:transketolase
MGAMFMKDTAEINRLNRISRTLRRDIVEIVGVGLAGHIGGSCSSADIVTALYFSKMHYDPKNIRLPDRDRFLLSKGHAAILQYAALAEAGYFEKEILKTTKCLDSILQGHPDYRRTPGVEANTGSLGQGLSIGLGIALGLRLDGIDRKVYVIMGDGEQSEGQIWEAAMAAANYKADNLVAILDRNRLQATDVVTKVMDSGSLADKWQAFGWHVLEIDGHDMGQILEALDEVDRIKGKPAIIIANTIKGKGISFAENVVGFHNGVLTQETYNQALSELA